jgi:hypothetical protein
MALLSSLLTFFQHSAAAAAAEFVEIVCTRADLSVGFVLKFKINPQMFEKDPKRRAAQGGAVQGGAAQGGAAQGGVTISSLCFFVLLLGQALNLAS